MVDASKMQSSFRFFICAARTASAIVKLDPIRMAVFHPPLTTSSSRLPSAKASGYFQR